MDAVTTLPRSRPLTVDDMALMPDDDGHRYEIIDGTLIVSAAPNRQHQRVAVVLARILDEAALDGMWVTMPIDVVLAPDTVVEPDLVVATRADMDRPTRYFEGPPVLAVEILSPSTRLIDLNLKRARYEKAGIPSYWIVDPVELELTAWRLGDDGYVEEAHVAGEDVWAATHPFPVTITPGRLLG